MYVYKRNMRVLDNMRVAFVLMQRRRRWLEDDGGHGFSVAGTDDGCHGRVGEHTKVALIVTSLLVVFRSRAGTLLKHLAVTA